MGSEITYGIVGFIGGVALYAYLDKHRCGNPIGRVYYNPLPHLYWADQFNGGLLNLGCGRGGWSRYERSDGSVTADTIPAPDGTQGALTGNKALILETGPTYGDCTAIKRTTWIWKKRVRYESWFVWKNFDNITNFNLLEFKYDTQIGVAPNEDRRHYGVHWINHDGTAYRRKWQYDAGSDSHHDWRDFPGDPVQELTCNCSFNPRVGHIQYKYNWIYIRFDINLETHKYEEFQCADRIWTINDSPIREDTPEKGMLNNLLNMSIYVSSNDINSTCYLYMDSSVMSGSSE